MSDIGKRDAGERAEGGKRTALAKLDSKWKST
jgi:hypothetical protein